MFAKVFTSILDSSVAKDYRVRLVFEDLLKLAEADGTVDIHPEAIARRTGVPLDIITHGLTELEKPDPESRTPELEGRRIVRLDDHRTWGWKIVNFVKYRQSATREMIRMGEAQRKAAYRARFNKVSPTPPSNKSTDKEREGEGEQSMDTSRTVRDLSGTKSPRHTTNAAGKPPPTTVEIIARYKADPTYAGIDVEREYGKMTSWCQINGKQPTERRFVNWLNRCDRSMTGQSQKPNPTAAF